MKLIPVVIPLLVFQFIYSSEDLSGTLASYERDHIEPPITAASEYAGVESGNVTSQDLLACLLNGCRELGLTSYPYGAENMILTEPYCEFLATFGALRHGNIQALSALKKSKEDLMKELQNNFGLSGLYYEWLDEKKTAVLIYKLLKMYPDLAPLVRNDRILSTCIYNEMSEEMIFLHQTCTNLAVGKNAERAFYSLYSTELTIIDYLARNVFTSAGPIEKAILAGHLVFDDPSLTLLKAAEDTGVLAQCDQKKITKFAAETMEEGLRKGDRQLMKIGMRLLMNPVISLSERLQFLNEASNPTTYGLLVLQLAAIQASLMLPSDIINLIGCHLKTRG